jgi:hypothetical protein
MNTIDFHIRKEQSTYGQVTVIWTTQLTSTDLDILDHYNIKLTVELEDESLSYTTTASIPHNDSIYTWCINHQYLNAVKRNYIQMLEVKAYRKAVMKHKFSTTIIRSDEEILDELHLWLEEVADDPSGYDNPDAHAIVKFWTWLTTKD